MALVTKSCFFSSSTDRKGYALRKILQLSGDSTCSLSALLLTLASDFKITQKNSFHPGLDVDEASQSSSLFSSSVGDIYTPLFSSSPLI